MRAKWLWITWAYLGLTAVIALEALFITFNVIYIIPKFQRLMHDGMIDSVALDEQGVLWMVHILLEVKRIGGQYTLWLILVPAVLWGLFEWRVRSEHKPFMRLAALGTTAMALMFVVILTTASMLIMFCLAMPALSVIARPWAMERVVSIDNAIDAFEKAQAIKDWPAMKEHAEKAIQGSIQLGSGPVVSIAPRNDSGKAENLRRHVSSVQIILSDLRFAAVERDEQKIESSLRQFRKAFEPVRAAAKNAKR
jgi:hypothetical protein